jgi:hypothetical protein
MPPPPHRHAGDQLAGALAGDEADSELGDDIRAAEKALYLASIQTVEPLEGARERRTSSWPRSTSRAPARR